jgi:hypothetical protein
MALWGVREVTQQQVQAAEIIDRDLVIIYSAP